MLNKTQFLEWESQQDQEKNIVRKAGIEDNKTLKAKGLSPVIHSLKVSHPSHEHHLLETKYLNTWAQGVISYSNHTTNGEKNDIIIWIMC